jgi:cell division protein FtsW
MSATGPIGVQRAGDSLYYVKHQIFSGIFPGLILFFFFSLINYRAWRSFAFLALIATLILLVLVYLPGVGLTINGARSWIQIGMLSFQPSELVKLTFLLYLAAWLEQRQSIVPFLCSLGAVMLLLILQPDTGSMVVIVGMSLLLYYLSGAPTHWFIGLGALGAGFVGLMIKLSPYRAARFMTFLHPELDPKGIGYHINQAILAIGSGGFWGLGYGHSRQKFLYLPEVESDSISAIIAEEMGFLVMTLLLVAFAFLIWRCFKISRECPDRFGSFLAAGAGCIVAIQVLMNIGSMTGLMPMTGVTLPFISHGGSAMTVLLGTMGLVAGIPGRAARQRRI